MVTRNPSVVVSPFAKSPPRIGFCFGHFCHFSDALNKTSFFGGRAVCYVALLWNAEDFLLFFFLIVVHIHFECSISHWGDFLSTSLGFEFAIFSPPHSLPSFPPPPSYVPFISSVFALSPSPRSSPLPYSPTNRPLTPSL